MIEIKVDPTKCGAAALAAIATMFDQLARNTTASASLTISPLDSPSAGAEVIKSTEPAPEPSAVFGGAPLPSAASIAPAPPAVDTPAPGAVFGGAPLPNGAAAAPIVLSPLGAAPLSTAAPVAPATVGSTVDLDAKGFPWDVRIHASTKTKNADGTWRYKRGVLPASIKTVEDELRAVMAIPAAAGNGIPAAPNLAPTTSAPPPPPPPPVASAASLVPPAPTGLGSSTTPAAPVSTAASASPSSPGAINTYAELAGSMTGALASGRMTQQECGAVLFEFGIGSLPLVSARPDLIPAIGARLLQFLAAKGA